MIPGGSPDKGHIMAAMSALVRDPGPWSLPEISIKAHISVTGPGFSVQVWGRGLTTQGSRLKCGLRTLSLQPQATSFKPNSPKSHHWECPESSYSVDVKHTWTSAPVQCLYGYIAFNILCSLMEMSTIRTVPIPDPVPFFSEKRSSCLLGRVM